MTQKLLILLSRPECWDYSACIFIIKVRTYSFCNIANYLNWENAVLSYRNFNSMQKTRWFFSLVHLQFKNWVWVLRRLKQVKAFATRPDRKRWSPGPTRWKERTRPWKLALTFMFLCSLSCLLLLSRLPHTIDVIIFKEIVENLN